MYVNPIQGLSHAIRVDISLEKYIPPQTFIPVELSYASEIIECTNTHMLLTEKKRAGLLDRLPSTSLILNFRSLKIAR